MGEASKVDKLFSASAVLFIALVVHFGISFLARVLIARVLGQFDYGAVSLGIMLLTTLSTIALLGLKTGIGRYLPRYTESMERRGVLVSSFQLAIPTSVVIALSILFSANFLAAEVFQNQSVAPTLRTFALAIPLATLMKLTLGTAQGLQQSVPRAILKNLLLPISRFTFIAVALYFGYRATGIGWAYIMAYLVVAGASVYYLVFHTSIFANHDYTPMHRELLSFSLPLTVMAMMEIVFEQLDTFIIAVFAEVEVVGVYNAVYPIAVLLTTVLIAFRFIAMPMFSEFHSNEEMGQLKALYQTVSKWIFVLTIPLLFVVAFFPKRIITLTFGPDFTAGAVALTILSSGFFTHAIAGLNGATLTAIGRTRTIMVVNIVVAIVNLILNLILIPRSPLIGAAVATAIAYTLMNVLYSYQLYTETGVHPITTDFKRISGVALLTMSVFYGIIGLALEVTNLEFLLLVGTFGISYLLLIIRVVTISDSERLLASRVEERLGTELTATRQFVKIIRTI